MSTRTATEIMPEEFLKGTLYTLYYRQGQNPHPMSKNFTYRGDIRETINYCKKYCETLSLRFIRVVPFISNLDEEMKTLEGSE